MSHLPIWIVVMSQLALAATGPVIPSRFFSSGIGMSIKNVPCVSLKTGETGVCMFALTCEKANGTHVATCMDRFYVGSCCRLKNQTEISPEENEIKPEISPSAVVVIANATKDNVIVDNHTNEIEPIFITTQTANPADSSTELNSVQEATLPTIPSNNIADGNNETHFPIPTDDLDMSDYQQVCGMRVLPESRIVGGVRSTFGKWPWQLSLQAWNASSSAFQHICGAVLLTNNWAITVAHCVESRSWKVLLLKFGSYDLSTRDEPYGSQERGVQFIIRHSRYDAWTFEYDLALLRFDKPLEKFQPNILPVCLPDDDDFYVGETAFVTGWGRLASDGQLPSVLHEILIPVISNTDCEGMYNKSGYQDRMSKTVICAGQQKGGVDSCEGDSGGPLVIQRSRDRRWILAGVASWGIGCAEPNHPGVYTRISEFRSWITQSIKLFEDTYFGSKKHLDKIQL